MYLKTHHYEFMLVDAGCPVFVIADNARYHHSKQVQEFLKIQSGEIMMAFLPAYSPELNSAMHMLCEL